MTTQQEQETFSCEWCYGDFPVDNDVRECVDGMLCYNCFVTWSGECENCGDIHHTDNFRYCDYCGLDSCYSCYEYHDCAEDEENRYLPFVNSYSYKPNPNFLGNGNMFMGVELEVDLPNGIHSSDVGNVEELVDIGKNGSLFYMKEDGSLMNGFEVVTHPATLSYHMKQFPWASVTSLLSNAGYKSHNTTTCGLHVHVNRTALGKTLQSQETVISKLVILFWKFWDRLVTFSRRNFNGLERWAKGNHSYVNNTILSDLDECKTVRDRYVAINMTNRDTIEFRMFRGTLKKDTIIATLQLIELMVQMCHEVGISYIYNCSWKAIVDRAERFPELKNYLQERELVCA